MVVKRALLLEINACDDIDVWNSFSSATNFENRRPARLRTIDKERKTNNDNNPTGEQTIIVEEENRLCIDSHRCDGILRKKSCSVVSNLVVTPFLATLEVLDNHLHTHHQQQHPLVQVKSVQIQSVVNAKSTTATTNG